MIAKTIRTCFPIAVAAVADKAEEINKLNVFPVPDGDTGTNMSLTLQSVVKELAALSVDADMDGIAGAITHGSLMGARGNSGVITSQILRGVAEGLREAGEPISSADIASAFRRAVKVAFQAVRKPIEGTILTVLRDVSTKADECEKRRISVEETLDALVVEAYQSVARTMLARHLDAFRTIPAAKSVHHSFLSGLLMHTSNMLRLADFLAGLYGEIIDRSLLLTGTLLHDFAKEKEFTFSGLGLVTDYSLPGQLIGHLVMGAQEVQQCAQELGISEEKSLLLQHMILSHHGEPEFGAAVRPMCAEAELLSEIDLIDSRMEIYAEALQDLPVGSFSNRIFALDKKIYRHG